MGFCGSLPLRVLITVSPLSKALDALSRCDKPVGQSLPNHNDVSRTNQCKGSGLHVSFNLVSSGVSYEAMW